MTRFPLGAEFLRKADDVRISGEIRRATEQDIHSQREWAYQAADEDKHWSWKEIFDACVLTSNQCECYAAIVDSRLEGLMAIDLRGRITSAGKAITVDYLATNPANRPAERGIKLIGLALLGVAIVRSKEVGLNGSFQLESLPLAESFYSYLGMRKESDLSEDGLPAYSMSPHGAERLLAEISKRGILKL